MVRFRTPSLIPFLLTAAVLFVLSGCASFLPAIPPSKAERQLPGIMVHTRDGGQLFFHDREWTLSLNGIIGKADVTDADGTFYMKDTTLSYFSAEAAHSTGRNSTLGQFMLTILGVILVIGLAAIILYAAFLATER